MEFPEYKNFIDVDKICRLCLTENEVLENLSTVNITVDNKSTKVLKLLNRVIDSPLKGDEESFNICMHCLDVATNVYIFKLQCESSIFLLEEYRNNTYVAEQILIEPIISEDDDTKEDIHILTEDLDFSNVFELDVKVSKPRKYRRKKNKTAVINPTSLKCDLCSKVFTNKYTLKHHFNRHMKQEPFICNICRKHFYTKGCLAKHLAIHGLKKYKCNECGREFSTPTTLEMHSLIHSSVRPYLCSLCGKAFRQPTSLSYHMRTHTLHRPYSCEFCGRRFSLYGNYNTHKRLHTGERPFTCEACGKGFVKKYDMKRHFSLIHSEKRDFLCIVCGKQFACEVYHRQHMMKHTQEFPHVCSICNKGFSRSYTLGIHKRICTVERLEEKNNTKKQKEKRLQLTKERKLNDEIRKVEKAITTAKKTNNTKRTIVPKEEVVITQELYPKNKNNIVRITRIRQKRLVKRY